MFFECRVTRTNNRLLQGFTHDWLMVSPSAPDGMGFGWINLGHATQVIMGICNTTGARGGYRGSATVSVVCNGGK